jgi:hypothetical protein
MLKVAKIGPGIHVADILEQPIGIHQIQQHRKQKQRDQVPIHRQDMPWVRQS